MTQTASSFPRERESMDDGTFWLLLPVTVDSRFRGDDGLGARKVA